MIGIRAYLMGGAAAVALSLAGAAWWGWQRVEHWRGVAQAAEARERAARATVELLRKEMESDNAIDAIPDDGLGDALDPRWLLPGGPK